MIIDAFLFCQEYDMLEFRLRLLYDHVDKFVIVEADKTFSGLDKPFNFEQHRAKYAWAEEKIKYFKLHCDTSGLNLADKPTEFQPNHDCWQIEYTQRNAIVTACEGFADDDIMLMGDVDEIPSHEAIEWAKQNVRTLPVACQQYFFYYNLKRLRQELCLTTIFSTLRTARSLGTQELRNRRNVLTQIGNSGWHLSYFDSADKIKNKIESFSHQELNRHEFKNDEHINHCISTGEDLFNRSVATVEVPFAFFPAYFVVKAQLFNWGLDKPIECNPTRKKKKAKISLTMIVRNEEHNLSHCLDSVRGLFDEIIIVDTGSTDSTKEMAAKYGAKIFDFVWIDDFSVARNVALLHASGDYTFWLDADDVLLPPERKKLEVLFKNLCKGQRDAYVMRCASERDSNSQIVVDHVRLFPRLKGIRWTYRVHEQILPSLLNAGVQVLWTDIVVVHKGYIDASLKERKRQRDWDILTHELETSPDDPFVLYNLGMIAFERERWQEALDYFNLSFAGVSKTPSLDSIRRKLFGMRAWAYQILGQLDESLRVCEEGLSVDREDAELWFRKAVAYRYQRKTVEAEACWRHILTLRRPERFCSIDQGIYGHLTHRNLAIIAEERSDHKEAQIHWQTVLIECPGDLDALRSLNSELAM